MLKWENKQDGIDDALAEDINSIANELINAQIEQSTIKTDLSSLKLNLDNLLDNKADKATTLSGYGITDAYTMTGTDELLNLVYENMDVRDTINLKFAKEYTNTCIVEATNKLEPFFAYTIANKDELHVNCGYHGITNAYNMNRCIYLKHNSKIYHLAALVNSEFIFFDYEGSVITVGMDADGYDYVIVNDKTTLQLANNYTDNAIQSAIDASWEAQV